MILLGGGVVITQDPENPVIQDGGVVFEGERILALGTVSKLKANYPRAVFHDVAGKVIMPGFINAHTHFYSAFARGMVLSSSPKDFLEILKGLWWKLDQALELEDVYRSGQVSAMECLRNGTTTVFDHHASPNCVKGSLSTLGTACKEVGLRASLSYEVSDRDGALIAERGIQENLAFFDACVEKKDPLLGGMFGLHASFTLTPATLKRCLKEVGNRPLGFHLHVAEGAKDRADSKENYGVPVVKRLDAAGILVPRTIAAHCIHVDEEEIARLAASRVFVAHNPQSNMGNAVGRTPLFALQKAGVQVGLGTDGYTADCLQEMKVANLLHKHGEADPRVGFSEAYAMLFQENARLATLQFGTPIGKLKEGFLADIVVLDYKPTTPLNERSYKGHILFGMAGSMTHRVYVQGELVLEDRKLLKIKEEAVLKESRARALALWKRL